ncbi:uncharacterized protein LOC111114484 [Crassostrea virginica]
MTRQTVPPEDQSGAENHQIAPSTSSHAQAALGTTKALGGEPPQNSNSANLTLLCPKQVKLSKTVGKEEGSDSCVLTALDVNDAVQNLTNVSSKKEKNNNFEKGKVIVGKKEALEKLLQELLNEERDLQTGLTEALRGVRSLKKLFEVVLCEKKDRQTGETEALHALSCIEKLLEGLNEKKDRQTGLTEALRMIRSLEKSVVKVLNKEKDLQTGVTGVLCAVQNSSKVEEVKVLPKLEHENNTGLYGSEILMENAGPAAAMTRQTVPPEDQSGAEYHQIAPSTSSHAQAALGTTKALEGESPHDSNSAELTHLCRKQVKLSKTVDKEEGSDSCVLTALDVNDAVQNLTNVSSKKEKNNNFEKGKVIVGEKEALGSLEKLLKEVQNEKKDRQTGLTEALRMIRSLEKSVVKMLNKEKDLQSGVTGVLCAEEIVSSDFYAEKSLGQGSFGSVDLCKNVNTNKEFARKKVQNSSKVEEVKVLLYLEHENITGLYGYIKREGVSEILMEYAGTNLQDFVEEKVKEKKVIEEALVWSVITQLLSALKYLWEHQIMHLDIKPLNICINNKNIVKLTDFGSAKNANQEHDFQGWTPEYMAPEMCRAYLKNHHPDILQDIHGDFSLTGKVDVFALGLVVQFMLEMTHSQLKYFTERADNPLIHDQTSRRRDIIKTNANHPNMVVMHMLTKRGSEDLQDLILRLLQGIPQKRLSAEQALLEIALEKSAENGEGFDLK